MSKEAMKLALDGKSLYDITGSITDIDKCIIHRFDLIQALAALAKQEHDGSLINEGTKSKQERGEPVGMTQVYRCKIKSRKQIDREIPREKQGWWADISAGQLIRLREATQADLDRCTLNGEHSKNPADYMCETHTNGSLVSKVALEYMNPEQNVFASTTPPQRKPLTDEQMNALWFDTNKQHGSVIWRFARAIEAAHGIKE